MTKDQEKLKLAASALERFGRHLDSCAVNGVAKALGQRARRKEDKFVFPLCDCGFATAKEALQ